MSESYIPLFHKKLDEMETVLIKIANVLIDIKIELIALKNK